MSESNEAFMRRFYEYWDAGDVEATTACFAEDAVYDNVPQNAPLVGREAIGNWLAMTFRYLDRIESEILNMASNGEWVLCERLDDNVFAGKSYPLPVMNATRIVDGRIAMFRDYYDVQSTQDLVNALGEVEA